MVPKWQIGSDAVSISKYKKNLNIHSLIFTKQAVSWEEAFGFCSSNQGESILEVLKEIFGSLITMLNNLLICKIVIVYCNDFNAS